MRSNTKIWIEGTIIAALSIMLSFLPTGMGTTFSISLGQITLTVYALRRGVKPAMLAGLIWGFLHFPLGQVIYLSVAQVLIEYILAYPFAGFAGFFAARLHKSIQAENHGQDRFAIISACLVGTFARYFWHFVAGYIFWGQYAMWGLSPVIYSLVINGTNALLTALAAIVILLIFEKVFPTVFIPKDQKSMSMH
ncbi:energy-coupled thiamine transporter ThiT [Tetragenococcus koreensis]|uniref:energy-coupled thiamine transporter ThiT n=1 Tax=Tetragenococcus koreensis TaxID=290335 RepID=UPI001F477059|nr:energy-coupled thiamine transporter ThiT [Tetragenococcus koreensis]MCF1585016.1 energy-coupled thiamine transporter ThiT [Tetragenococcus koreensis]MCF1614579.1 energy-coupled thiamine transporter ThiT [Tetragenococcus koreensis]MCF1617144.1 energy-coupled thiamine transporter ThiT [Tetragenococcus koreensis]MCF1619403.1 energy-coupled thiamine transporter ThiT [Tetragenococcus koreensis]MCF1622004.1 energy-coupled thiamine transporter ThiT [Tetragenococcus koreensis]